MFTVHVQVLLGPIAEVELVDPPDLVPAGVNISIRHLLSVPKSVEVRQELESSDDNHNIVKITQAKGESITEIIDTQNNVTSEYFSTDKFTGRPLCQITTTKFFRQPYSECNHSAPKTLIFTHDKKMCPHQAYALSLYCYCDAYKDRFQSQIEEQGHKVTTGVMKHNVERSCTYNISAKFEKEWKQATLSFNEMCKYIGVKKLYDEKPCETYSCCSNNLHCGGTRQVTLKAEENARRGKVKEKMNIDTLNLHCEKSDSFDIPEDNRSLTKSTSVQSARSSELPSMSKAPSSLSSTVTFNYNISNCSVGNITKFRSSLTREVDQIFYNKFFQEKIDEGYFAVEDEVLTSSNIEELPAIEEIERSHCLLAWGEGGERSYGTAFVGSFKDGKGEERNCLFTAGHNFPNMKSPIRSTIQAYELFFENRLGFLNKEELDDYNKNNPSRQERTQYVRLTDIIDNTYVWSDDKNGERPPMQKIAGMDYAVLLLKESKVKDLNLHCLKIYQGQRNIIDIKNVIIFGHPATKEWKVEKCLKLRVSVGNCVNGVDLKTKLESADTEVLPDIRHRLFYSNSTMKGNSGSPVLAQLGTSRRNTKYQVVAIHSGGIGSDRAKYVNYGQRITAESCDILEKILEKLEKPRAEE